MTTEARAPQKILIVGLLFFFAAVVLATVARRIENPSLVARRAPEAPESEMARLMKEAAARPADANLLAKLAGQLLARNESDAASDFIRRALEADPQNANALHLAGVISHRKGDHAKAAEFLERSVASSENAAARYSLGVLYSHFLDDREKAALNFRKGLEAGNLSPDLREALEKELAGLKDAPAPQPKPGDAP